MDHNMILSVFILVLICCWTKIISLFNQMSFEKQVEIYSYTLTLLNLTLKVKFPCRLYLEHQGKAVTSEVSPTAAGKFIFNQQVSLKNESDKKHLELVVQLLTEKGNKYVGGVVKLPESDLVASEGECMAVPVSKCLDAEAICELRVDQVSTSRIVRKGSPKRAPLRSEYHPDPNHNFLYSSQKPKPQQNQTKSEYNFPISMARKDRRDRSKQPMIVVNSVRRGFNNEESRIERQGVGSMAGGPALSSLEFQVYKQGYNKLKEKYRKEAETARSEMNKRLALQNNQNNLKLQSMRYKLKAEELEKTLLEKAEKIKELGETITALQKKELDSKYLKEQVENKNYTIKSLEQTIKSLNRDNNELKALQSQRYQTEQEMIQALRDQVDKTKRDLENRQNQLLRQLKIKNDTISKIQYSLHNKSEELERTKCNIEDLDKSITNKTFEWQKVLQNEKNNAIAKQQELKVKIVFLKNQKSTLNQQISQLQQNLQDKNAEISRLQYDKKVMSQNNESLHKQNEQLKMIKQKYIELNRQHKAVSDDKAQIQKAKERQTKSKQAQIQELHQKIRIMTESNKKVIKQLEQKLKANQLKLIQNDSQNEALKNQLDKLRRQFQSSSKENNELRTQLKDSRADIKAKEEAILQLTNELSNLNNRYNQGEQSTKQQITRLKEDIEKLSNSLKEAKDKSIKDTENINQLELTIKKLRLEMQHKEERAIKDLTYSKEKVSSLQTIKDNLEAQINSLTQNIVAFKANQAEFLEKIQKLQLQAIKSREFIEKLKKEVKVLQEKVQNNEINLKNKATEYQKLQQTKQNLEKIITEREIQIGVIKNQLSKQVSEKKRFEKIGEILQADLTKSKEEQTKLNGIIAERDSTEAALREQLKKQKEQYTKLDMKLNGLRKQFDKFKETLVDNLNTVFSSIPEGLNYQSRLKSNVIDKTLIKENNEVLNLLISLGRDARINMSKTLDQLKQTIRDNQKLNSEYSISMNKSNTAEFEYSQNITQIQEEMAQLLEEKTIQQNKYEEQIFILEGRLKEKDVAINELTEDLQECDFLLKNTKNQFEIHKEQAYRKDSAKSKQIEQLREQIEYQVAEIQTLEHDLQKYHQSLESAQTELGFCKQTIQRLTKEGNDARQNIAQLEESITSLKKELKRANEKNEELSMNVAHKEEQLVKNQQTIQEEQRKASELREFLKVVMRQKEQIIKNELEKSEKVLQLETSLEQIKHELEILDDSYKISRNNEEQLRQTIKKLSKSLKDEEAAKIEERAKGNKLSDKLKDKEKEIAAKDDTIAKLEDRLKKESEKKGKDLKQLEAELDQTYQKLLTAERQSAEKILALENLNEKKTSQIQKLTESLSSSDEALYRHKNRYEQTKERLAATEKQLIQTENEVKQLAVRVQSLNEQLRVSQEQSFKLQGKLNLLQMKFDMKESENNDKMQNLNEDWSSKYFSMQEQYEQRLELVEKQRDFLKEKLAQSDKEVKKLTADMKNQEVNITSLKKACDDKVRALQEDRLAAIGQKNTANQRLVDEVRTTFEGLKQKQSQCRKLTSQLELIKVNLAKVEARWKEAQQKIRSLNRNYQAESQEMRKKETSFKRLKESITSAQWKGERQVRKLIQNSSRQIVELVDQKSTIRVMEVSRVLEQSVLAAISLKIDDKDI